MSEIRENDSLSIVDPDPKPPAIGVVESDGEYHDSSFSSSDHVNIDNI